ncbi:MFS transporter [Leucobacter sp. L43]|uniref:MFS transporter n=1 Tax=Leucobacter sp. L43 TaxID=2798040 RepID=UPI001F39E489|nr:MFS transporter [Leucobacter sp. L43]
MPELSTRHRWVILVLVSLGLLMVALDNSVLYTALPKLTEDLRASSSEGLWIINAYPLVMAGLLLGAGTLGDKYGHKPMFIWGLIVFGIASLVAAFAPTAAILITGRALLAVGAAMIMPATLALIRQTFADARERNMAIGVWASVSLVGPQSARWSPASCSSTFTGARCSLSIFQLS